MDTTRRSIYAAYFSNGFFFFFRVIYAQLVIRVIYSKLNLQSNESDSALISFSTNLALINKRRGEMSPSKCEIHIVKLVLYFLAFEF
jgi:hypothetical protein